MKMGIFKKKADAEIIVRVFDCAEGMKNKVKVKGNPLPLWSAFEALCIGMLEMARDQGDALNAAVFAEVMEKALRKSISDTGVKSLDDFVKAMMCESEAEE
jgi:hypothetical protein